MKPSRNGALILAGDLEFCVEHRVHGRHCESFAIKMRVSPEFPAILPSVWETAKRIPDDFHKLEDNALCLGSPLGLRVSLGPQPDLIKFVERCLIPYLFGFVQFERTAVMPFGELAHGNRGLLDEYKVLLGVPNDRACIELLKLAGLKKRIANKRLCPCGSGLRLGRCHNRRVNRLRPLGSRAWFRFQAETLDIHPSGK